ncbi:MAG: MBL fold metallo-hydrolase [Chloroflexi bacterium]|nr:MBL fold metallo-hydrolase [Chloroflexota bacterium]
MSTGDAPRQGEITAKHHCHPFESLLVPQGAVGIHWFGQSSFAIKDSKGTILLIDPYFPRERPPEEYVRPISPLDEATLRTDAVFLTHDHGDHTCMESLLRIRSAFPLTRYWGPMESIARLREHGFPEDCLSTVSAGDRVHVGSMVAHVVWAKLPEGAPEDGIAPPDVIHLGMVLEAGTVRIYVSGDLFNSCARHEAFLGPIRQLNPDIGLLTSHPTEGEFPYFAGAVELATRLNLKAAVPAHYDCFIRRTYDPYQWAAQFPSGGPVPVIIPYNEALVYSI